MPITAMIRNLATMTANGFLAPGNAAVAHIVERLTNPEAITKARVHPIALLIAMRTYAQGHGEKGSLTWIPVPEIVGALDAAFYLAFGNVVPAGKRTLVALDVSDSMTWPQNTYSGLKAREACAAMAMIQVATEPTCEVVAFSDNIATVPLRPNQRLADVTSYVGRLRASSTDCSLPMLWAIKHQRAFDTFVIYTDNETNFGIIHPFQALRQYRNATGIDAKLVVCATTATPNTIADPTDKGMLDISGFDASVPTMIADFSRA
jgi:60 kDa SS-A/Ro ribonucleoprotein